GNRGTYTARSARDERHSPHEFLPIWRSLAPAVFSMTNAPAFRKRRHSLNRTLMQRRRRSIPLDAHGDAHAAADAQRGEALFGIALLHLVQQRHQHASAGCADRMADGAGAALDGDLARIPAEILVHGKRLRGEGFVGLDQIEIADLPAGLL